MNVDPEDLFPDRAASQSVVRSFADRVAPHSLELVLQLQDYLERNGEDIDERQTFDGGDASAKMFFALLEALLAYEQLRLELMAQTPDKLPARLLHVMSIGSRLEPGLLHMAKEAFSMHTHLWDAGTVASRKRKKPEPFY